jgi:hypothetical protein
VCIPASLVISAGRRVLAVLIRDIDIAFVENGLVSQVRGVSAAVAWAHGVLLESVEFEENTSPYHAAAGNAPKNAAASRTERIWTAVRILFPRSISMWLMLPVSGGCECSGPAPFVSSVTVNRAKPQFPGSPAVWKFL